MVMLTMTRGVKHKPIIKKKLNNGNFSFNKLIKIEFIFGF